ncbi:MAG: hypothetical protein KTR30_16735 [Saprospiraceae bacterium]|nr:hypothetical protein [Saprospiraceae bacterium]
MKWTYCVLLLLSLCFSCTQSDSHPEPVTQTKTADKNNFLLSPSGDTIATGVRIPTSGITLDRKQLAKPRISILNPLPNQQIVHNNINRAKQGDIIMLPEKLPIVEIGAQGIPLPQTIPIKGKVVQVHEVPATTARDPIMKDLAIADLRCLDVDQGMKASLVTDILQDQRGYLWVGTDGGGISRYDGNSFTHFTTESGLSNNSVNDLLEDQLGNIWIGTQDGLNRYDGHAFTHFTTEEGLPHNRIIRLFGDRKGRIWIGTNRGLGRYETNTAEDGTEIDGYLTIYTKQQGFVDDRIRPYAEDSQGNIWLGSYNQGAYRLTLSNTDTGGTLLHLSTKEGLSGNRVRTILADSQDNIWIGTFNNGLNIYHAPSQQNLASLRHYSSHNGLSHSSVISMLEDRQQNIWIGTGSGFNKYEPRPDGGANFTFYSTEQGLSHTNIYAMASDRQGNLWLGTHTGLCIYDPAENAPDASSHFTHFSTRDGLLSDKVISIMEDQRGGLWFGTMGGLHQYDGQTIAQYTTEDGLSSKSVRAMMEDSQGDLWFGTERGGLHRFDPGTRQVAQYGMEQGLSDIHITAMLEDSRGNYWFGTLQDGINRFRPDASGLEGIFTQYSSAEGLLNPNIRYILEDHQGQIWFGTMGGGVSCYIPNEDDAGGAFQHFTTHEGLSHNSVNAILQDHKGNLWFGTWGGGVTHYNPATQEIHYLTTKEGLSSNIIWTIVEDRDKRIWMATEHGLSLLVPNFRSASTASNSLTEAYQIYTFGKPDGLKGIVFEGNSVCLSSKNQMWWGGGFNGGLTRLDLNQFQLPTKTPTARLNSINIQQRFVDYRNLDHITKEDLPFVESLHTSVDSVVAFHNYPTTLLLPYHLNHLTFQFSALDWSAPHKIQYSYQMEGLENNWSIPSTSNIADYRNLPYGEFTLKVKTIGLTKRWSEPFSYTFTIQPPWWHQWWARLIYGLLLSALLYGFIQSRLNKLRKERNDKKAFAEALIVAQEEEKKRIARDLHDGIGQSLLLIKKQMEKTAATSQENQRLIASTLEEVRAISQDLHPFQLEKFGLTSTIVTSLEKIEKSTNLFITHAIENIDKKLSAKAEINLYRTIQEAMSNIVKHAEASAAKITVSLLSNKILVIIQDNGKGFDTEIALATSKSLGLRTMHERIVFIGGTLSIKTRGQKGTLVEIQVPTKH